MAEIHALFKVNPVVALLGPRQCGKSTLADQFSRKHGPATWFDLERPVDLERLANPGLALEDASDLVVIDEVQRSPGLFSFLRSEVDRARVGRKAVARASRNIKKRRFLVLGSASRDLIRQSAETLAGRISYLEAAPFSLEEVRDESRLWLRGGFPRSYLARSENESRRWRQDYIATFLERDIPNLGLRVAPAQLRRFWMMLAHYHGQVFNASEIGTSLGVAHTTAQSYLDILSGTFMVRQLNPWFENIGKRQVKSKKIYIRDSGVFHELLGVPDRRALKSHPKLGASWEGFALEACLRALKVRPEDSYFWAVHEQAELDLLVTADGRRRGFEFKYTDAPRLTRSMETALKTLNLEELTVVYPGAESYPLGKRIRVVPLSKITHRSA